MPIGIKKRKKRAYLAYSNSMTKIALIILNFNLKDAVLECLQSTSQLRHDVLELETIVVDNNSTDGSQEAIKKAYPSITFLETGANLGFAGGNNIGMKYALEHQADFVIVLNPDVYVDTNLVTALHKGFTNENIGITAPKVYFAKGFEFHKDRYSEEEKGNVIWFAGGEMDWNNIIGHHRGVDEVDHGQYDDNQETAYASGNCMMIKREVLEKVGFFDEKYFLYYEDADFCMRVKKAGYKIMYTPTAKLWHKNAQASGGSGNPLQDYFISRNRLLFGFTYGSLRTKFALFRESLRSFFSYPTRRKAVLDFYLRKFGKGSYLA